MPADLRSAGNKYHDFSIRCLPFFLFNDSIMQINLWKKSECFSDQRLAALTFGSDILSCRIFRFAQQPVHIRQYNSLVVSVAAGMEKPRGGLMSKICKQNVVLCLTCSLGMASCDINRKQNFVCCFQTVNLSFSSRKRPTFASKVARFLSANSRLIV